MEDDGAGGVVPGFPTHTVTHIDGASLLTSDGVNSEQLSNFDLTVVDDDVIGTTVSGHFTYANSANAINGAVTVNIVTSIVYAPLAIHPKSGVFEIIGNPGKIRVTILSDSNTLPSVQVEVFANAADPTPTVTYPLLTWAQFEALI